jgi:hypothetical protein
MYLGKNCLDLETPVNSPLEFARDYLEVLWVVVGQHARL